MSRTRAGVAGLVPPIGRTTWLLLALNLLSCFGSGLTKPFLIVYLHEARGIGLGTAGLLLSSIGFAGVVAMPLAGVLIDRIGPVRAFAAGQVLGGVGTAWFVLAATPGMALVACLLLGASGGITTNGLSTLLAVVVPVEQRGAAFGLGYTTYNLGTGVGAVAAGFVISFGSTTAYTTVFLVDGASFLVFAVALLALERRVPAHRRATGRHDIGYRVVLADRALLAAFLLNTLFWAVALSQTTVAFPAWATGPAGVSTAVVGVAFAVNTAVLALSQLLVIRRSKGYRRTSLAAVAGLLFATAWLLMVPATGGVLLVFAMAVFALGEAALAPTLPALINDLADADLRGRYNAVFNLSSQVGQIVGPAVAGWLLGGGNGVLLLATLAGTCLVASAACLAARRVIPPGADRTADQAAD
ncbi:MFS transporter [Labedaea rhizosphaerae]|uniref:Na+/melibiose symporter-like transporter n=1 Tax=Labedaea rhizosphaerae TaxID=598644 RepID=A0A4V3CX48_LABRH|nr:MFS transporter [Labedaea rhizosphaerae]TDP88898.1 Na+/melibiose symporter-like transporter [Labedaea rhizosphaerae]